MRIHIYLDSKAWFLLFSSVKNWCWEWSKYPAISTRQPVEIDDWTRKLDPFGFIFWRSLDFSLKAGDTPLKTNSSSLRNDGWSQVLCLWFRGPILRGELLNFRGVNPWKLTRNLKIPPWKRRNIYKPPIFGFHVKVQGCMSQCLFWGKTWEVVVFFKPLKSVTVNFYLLVGAAGHTTLGLFRWWLFGICVVSRTSLLWCWTMATHWVVEMLLEIVDGDFFFGLEAN